MRFRLFYRGELKTNRGPKDKQKIRRVLHSQLSQYWQQKPLNTVSQHLLDPSNEINSLRKIGKFTFVPLVTEKLNLVSEIEIVLLRPEEPGFIVTQSGDIDNRLKTFLDSLRMPHVESELPPGDVPNATEEPFYCLLEDDNLITSLSVTTDRLLMPTESDSEVIILLHVKTRLTCSDRWIHMNIM